MTKIRVTKEFDFEMAHALWNYDGPCKNIHGHSYELKVTLIGEPNKDIDDPKNGMVVDFGDIKKWIKDSIINEFDHALLVSKNADISGISESKQMFSKLKVMDFQPTCENLLVYFVEKIRKLLPDELQLHSLLLRETGSSYAEWHDDDNK